MKACKNCRSAERAGRTDTKCPALTKSRALCSVLFFSFVLAPLSAAGNGSTAQSSAQGTSISVPVSPSMPTVSAPAIGNGFYMPGSEGFYSGQKNIPATKPKTTSQDAADTSQTGTETSASNTGTASSAAVKYNIASEAGNSLTAGDISTLDSLGLMGSFSGLLGGSSALSKLTSAASADTLKGGSTDTVLLQQILKELDELKKTVNADNTKAAAAAANSQHSARDSSQILRFTLNGRDMSGFCRTVYFSKPESDGSFLMTGDVTYNVNNRLRTETFYILFHATGTKNSCTCYKVTPSLSQSTQDSSTYLYKFSRCSDLTASKTGNLVTLKTASKDLTADLLISLE